MLKIFRTLFRIARLVAPIVAFGRLAVWLVTAVLHMPLDMESAHYLLRGAYYVVSSTPVFMLSSMLTGVWIAEAVDAVLYRRETDSLRFSRRLVRLRLLWTRGILDGWFYPNDDRKVREVERANAALAAARLPVIPDPVAAVCGATRAAAIAYLTDALSLLNVMAPDRARSFLIKAHSEHFPPS